MTTLPEGLSITSPDLDDLDDLLAWRRGFTDVFAMEGGTREEMGAVQPVYRDQRLTGVRDGGRWVATFRSWHDTTTVPGGALTGHDPAETRTVDAELVSSVAVSGTHRRRGLLTALMTDCLRHAHERGAVVSSLFASEAAIYGRFGYGVATEVADLTVDTRAVRSWAPVPAAEGRLRLGEDDELLDVGPAVFEAARLRMPGAVSRNDISWRRLTERLPQPSEGAAPRPRLRVLHEAPDGRVDGVARVRLDGRWEEGSPATTATVDELSATDPVVAAALWRFVLDLDLVRTVKAEHRSPDDLLRHLPLDLRAVRREVSDGHWWRVLDTTRLLVARRWGVPDRIVLEVVDPGGPAGGRWLLDVDESGRAEVTATSRSADLTLPVQSVPAVVCGVRGLGPLVASRALEEHTAGAAARLARTAHVSPVPLAPFQGF